MELRRASCPRPPLPHPLSLNTDDCSPFWFHSLKFSSHAIANSHHLWRTTCPWFLILARRLTSLTPEMTANWGSFPGERCWTTPKCSFLLPACEIGRHNQKKIVELPDGRCQKKQWGGLGCCLPLLLFFSSFYSVFAAADHLPECEEGGGGTTRVPEVVWSSGVLVFRIGWQGQAGDRQAV